MLKAQYGQEEDGRILVLEFYSHITQDSQATCDEAVHSCGSLGQTAN